MTLITVEDSSTKTHYQTINYKGTVYRQSAERKILNTCLETRSHHLSILVAENSLMNVFDLTILMCHCINMANHSVFFCASPH